MDKILSARLDESVIKRIGSLASQLKTTKKQIIENAVVLYAEKVEKETMTDIMDQTFGAWHRDESASETVRQSRRVFQNSIQRHQR